MRAAIFNGPRDIGVGGSPRPRRRGPDGRRRARHARVRVRLGPLVLPRRVAARPRARIGHEFIGIVEEVGAGRPRASPSATWWSRRSPTATGPAPLPAGGRRTACTAAASATATWTAARARPSGCPFADATLVKVPGRATRDATLRSFLTLSDVMCTGHHAAVSAGVQAGDTVAVVGDGAVGLSRGARREAPRRGADHRPVPEPGPPGGRPRVRCDGRRCRARRRGDRGGAGADRRHRRGRGARVRRHRTRR